MNSNKNPPSTEELLQKCLQMREWWQIKSRRESLPRTTKAMLASSLRANHWWQYWTHKDSEVCKLHEWYLGARARALRQEGVQSGHRHCQYQLDNDRLACNNTSEAAHQKSSPWLHDVKITMCHTLGGAGTGDVPSEPSQKVSQIFERNGLQEITCENKISLLWGLRTQWITCPGRIVQRNESERKIPPCKLTCLGEKSQLNVKC